MAAFISFHARHSVPGRQFAPSWTVCTNPVQSDCCALSGNYRLESNPERHAKAPLAAATGN
ncbi:hypothetical protein EIN43_26990 (plasmid) [Enterobacter hormaechei]|uniref:Replication initiation protein n=1 Tax=Enterobacter hormaechei TaxID=158836 RepID=A0A4Y5ZQS8_9ENTR|nr:hypothetical protein EIN43_26990 [Enterobacter hormaechei]